MGLISAFLTHTAHIEPFKRMINGRCVYGDAEERKCRIQRGLYLETVYKNPSGQIDEVRAQAKLFCEGGPIPEHSKISIDDEEKQYTVIRCYQAEGFGPDHQEAYLM